MWGRRTRWFFISLLIICILLAPIISTIQSGINPAQNITEPTIDKIQLNTNSGNQVEEIEYKDNTNRGYSGGELEWSIKLSQDPEEAMLSTPAICDLNPPAGNYGKRYLETVVACTDDHIYAVDHNGKEKWVYSDCVIDDLETIIDRENIQLDISPPPIFSSITPIDIGGGKAPELLVGEQDGMVCLSPDGSTFWKDKCSTDGYYLPNIAVVDLEGDYRGMDIDGNFIGYREDLEILFGSFNIDLEQGFIECWQSNGQKNFGYEMSSSGQSYLISNIVVAELDGWFFNNEKRLEKLRETNEHQNPETLFTDIIITTDNSAGKIWKHTKSGEWNEYYEVANISGFETYSTVTVANFSGGQELECIVGTGSGGSTWETSEGTVLMYRQDGNLVCYPFFTGPAPSSVFSSPASCDAQNIVEKDLKPGQKIDYEVYFGCDNGIFYCLSGTDLTELWHYQTGGRILSSPAICNINSDDSLEVVVGSNDGKVYCFEGDPQELDLYGVPHPKDDGIPDDGGDSGEFDILWVFDTNTVEGSSGEIGISSPVVGDIDYDGELEVLIGDTEGTLYCISAGGVCISGQVDWHKIHYDLNNTGFYKQNPYYGVKIEPQITHFPYKDKCKCNWEKTVRPGEVLFHNYTITNIGNHMPSSDIDRFYIRISQFVYKNCNFEGKKGWPKPILTGEDLKWSGGKNGKGDPYVDLKIFESTNISVAIRGPWTGEINEFCDLEVEVNSSEHVWVRDSVQTRTLLDVYLDFDIEILQDKVKDKFSDLYGNKVIKIPPGGQATVEVELQNLGNMNDSYDLQIKGVINGWEAYFEDTHSMIFLDALQLDAEIMADPFIDYYQGNEDKVSFNITAPKEAHMNEMIMIKIIATSKYSQSFCLIENVSKYDILVIGIDPKLNWELNCSEPLKYIDPGKSVVYNMNISNHGSFPITVELSHNDLNPGWNLTFLNELGITLEQCENKIEVLSESVTMVQIVLKSPGFALAESKQIFSIYGTSVSSINMTLKSTNSLDLTSKVNQLYEIKVNITPHSIMTDPGKEIIYNLTVINLGNGDDVVSILPILHDRNWNLHIYLNYETRLKTELKCKEIVSFQLKISIPCNYLAGKYRNYVNVSSLENFEVVSFDTIINKTYDLSILGMEYSPNINQNRLINFISPNPGISPGTSSTFLFEITNDGNAPDLIQIEVEPEENEWNGWVSKFFAITNTKQYISSWDIYNFGNTLNIPDQSSPIGYLNNNPEISQNAVGIYLNSNQKIWLTIQLHAPRDIVYTGLEEIMKFYILGFSKDPIGKYRDLNLMDNEVKIELNILFPDLLVLNAIQHTKHIESGEIITVSIEIRNIGDIEARGVLITFFVDDKEISTKSINFIENGSSRLITFTWQAISGNHEFKITADPGNRIIEKNEKNNEVTKNLSLNSNWWDLIFGYIIWISILCIGIFLFLILIRKSKKNEKHNPL